MAQKQKRKELQQSLIDLRRSKVLEALAQGFKTREISSALSISNSTVKRDIGFMQKKARENIRYFVQDRLIFEFDKALATLDIINRKVWAISSTSESKRESLEAYSLLKDINRERLDVLTHSNFLQQALNISEKNNRKLDRLEAKYKAVSSGRPISKPEREEIERKESEPEIEQTVSADIQGTAENTHKPEESNG